MGGETSMDFDGWQIIGDLGEGGQGKVFKVRSPQVADRRAKSVETLLALMRNENPMAFVPEPHTQDRTPSRVPARGRIPGADACSDRGPTCRRRAEPCRA